MSWAPDGERLVSCSGKSLAHIWDATTGENIFTYHGHETSPQWQPVDATLCPLPRQSVPAEGQLYQYVGISPSKVNVVAWSPDGKWIASGGAYDAIHVWSAE